MNFQVMKALRRGVHVIHARSCKTGMLSKLLFHTFNAEASRKAGALFFSFCCGGENVSGPPEHLCLEAVGRIAAATQVDLVVDFGAVVQGLVDRSRVYTAARLAFCRIRLAQCLTESYTRGSFATAQDRQN